MKLVAGDSLRLVSQECSCVCSEQLFNARQRSVAIEAVDQVFLGIEKAQAAGIKYNRQ